MPTVRVVVVEVPGPRHCDEPDRLRVWRGAMTYVDPSSRWAALITSTDGIFSRSELGRNRSGLREFEAGLV
jgi:hypothetical protein